MTSDRTYKEVADLIPVTVCRKARTNVSWQGNLLATNKGPCHVH